MHLSADGQLGCFHVQADLPSEPPGKPTPTHTHTHTHIYICNVYILCIYVIVVKNIYNIKFTILIIMCIVIDIRYIHNVIPPSPLSISRTF